MSADHHKNATNGDADLANENEGNNNSNIQRPQQDLQLRSFWKAGDFDVGSSKATLEQGQLEHARVHPKFLHSNATSHKWAFGAIAELLDNAVDEISNGATFVKLDKISNAKDHTPALLFQDNGGGMDPGSLRKCMSLGYSNKKGDTIGQYGNGFKTSTMRLGADVIVFTRTTQESRATQSIGLLSYTFLRTTGQDDVIVPMIDFEFFGDRREPILYSSLEEWSSNLRIVLEWSPFASEEELMLQFEDIGPHGTKIMIYNLWLNDDGLLELDFNSDEEDIRLRDEANREKSHKKFDKLIESHISYHIRFSLRAYVSILYLKRFDNFEFILRGKPVQQHNIVNDLKYTEVVMYRPKLGTTSKEVSVKTEIGFVKEAPLLQVSGFNVYHKNRLIRPFWKVNSNHNSMGNGVVGVLEANFIEPAHDKQDFERSALFFKLETKLKQMSSDFWKKQCHLLGIGTKSLSIIRPDSQKESPKPVDAVESNFQTNFGTDQAVIGLSVNMQQGVIFSNPVIGLAANPHSLSNGQAGNPREGSRHQGSSKDASVDRSSSTSLDQMCEENIQLFMRCEEHRQKETNLKQMIEELERELVETKRKCSQLSSHLETQKKKKTTHQIEKA